MRDIGHLVGEPADLLVCLAHPKILKPSDWAPYKYGAINFHAGLPNYRGRHPLQWMLIDGVKEIPVAVHFIDEGVDTGDIIADDAIPVERNETYASALAKVTALVGPLVLEAIESIEAGKAGRKQGAGLTIRKRTPDDSKVDLKLPSLEAHRFINALSDPMPNAELNGIKYKWSWWGDGKQIVMRDDGEVCEYPTST